MKTKTIKNRRLNRWSYCINGLFTVPVLTLSVSLGRSYDSIFYDDQKGIAAIAQLISAIFAILLVVWTVQRLHDLGRSGWFALLLIPPFTIFLWGYLLFGSYDKSEDNKWGEHSEQLRIFGIQASNIWRLLAIMGITLIMAYLWIVLYGFASIW